jgi:CubicO group peptidase (beta-lactamase class C family)
VGRDPRLNGTPAPVAHPLNAVARWPLRSAAAGVVRRTGTGVEIIEQTGDPTIPYPWASVTKLLVAMAVLVATEEGTVGLDDAAGPPGSTVRHLLSHASGLGPDGDRPLTAPGRRRIYSNVGYELLADVVAQHSGMPFTDYLTTGVVLPLNMTGTALAPGSSPASGARGPLLDLLGLAGELLVPRLVSPSSLAAATAVAFPGLAGVLPGFGRFDPCDWGLGFEVRDGKTPHWTGTRNSPATFGHFGQSGSFLWVDPVAQVACAALGDGAFGPWAAAAWPLLADAVIDRWADQPRSPHPPGAGDLGTLRPGAADPLA